MTNEELVALIQGGDREKLPQLWEQVERFVAQQANRRLVLSGGLGGVEFGDLYNAGYLALVAAVDTFDPEAGRSFIGRLSLSLKTAFAEAGGCRSRKQAMDPLHHAKSLEAPAGDDEDGAAVVDLIADPAAALAFERVENRLYQAQLHSALEEAMEQLPPDWRDTLKRRFYRGQTVGTIAADTGAPPEAVRKWQHKSLRKLARRPDLLSFVELRTPYYMGLSAKTGERTTEMIALRREDLRGVGT